MSSSSVVDAIEELMQSFSSSAGWPLDDETVYARGRVALEAIETHLATSPDSSHPTSDILRTAAVAVRGELEKYRSSVAAAWLAAAKKDVDTNVTAPVARVRAFFDGGHDDVRLMTASAATVADYLRVQSLLIDSIVSQGVELESQLSLTALREDVDDKALPGLKRCVEQCFGLAKKQADEHAMTVDAVRALFSPPNLLDSDSSSRIVGRLLESINRFYLGTDVRAIQFSNDLLANGRLDNDVVCYDVDIKLRDDRRSLDLIGMLSLYDTLDSLTTDDDAAVERLMVDRNDPAGDFDAFLQRLSDEPEIDPDDDLWRLDRCFTVVFG